MRRYATRVDLVKMHPPIPTAGISHLVRARRSPGDFFFSLLFRATVTPWEDTPITIAVRYDVEAHYIMSLSDCVIRGRASLKNLREHNLDSKVSQRDRLSLVTFLKDLAVISPSTNELSDVTFTLNR